MTTCRIRDGGWRIAAIAFATLIAQPLAAQQPPVMASPDSHSVAADVSDAAHRFGIPERWIYAVMRAESAGRVDATSPVGAMGLMQIMPATWEQLRARYGLGNDAYHRRDNIMAGAVYIREMYDRYGAPGFLAAYNAGPGRYENYLNSGRPLPAETRNYVAQVAPALDGLQRPERMVVATDRTIWARAALFVPRAVGAVTDPENAPSSRAPAASQPLLGGLFVALSGQSSR